MAGPHTMWHEICSSQGGTDLHSAPSASPHSSPRSESMHSIPSPSLSHVCGIMNDTIERVSFLESHPSLSLYNDLAQGLAMTQDAFIQLEAQVGEIQDMLNRTPFSPPC